MGWNVFNCFLNLFNLILVKTRCNRLICYFEELNIFYLFLVGPFDSFPFPFVFRTFWAGSINTYHSVRNNFWWKISWWFSKHIFFHLVRFPSCQWRFFDIRKVIFLTCYLFSIDIICIIFSLLTGTLAWLQILMVLNKSR